MVTTSDYSVKEFNDRLKSLYPKVNEEETPLPRKWSPRDKFTFITLSQDNLKVTYMGEGKTHRDAASVRATHPIPTSCGIYYFEVKIISKGRDGYMGIGLSAQGVSLNRLPGWDKLTYGYHGDDGHSFCSSGTGQPYGPTFTTGDVVGCCLNLVNRTCFYTKNGIHIGEAFQNLPAIPLYPTVGLQTPNEELSANFGQYEFMFDFEDYIKEWRKNTQVMISKYTIDDGQTKIQTILHKLVTSYLLHHGYVVTTDAFNQSISQKYDYCEEIASINNRQKIKRLVLAGRIGEAIDNTETMFPGLLTNNPNLHFKLKVRQFIEMVNGTDSEVKNLSKPKTPRSNYSSPALSPKHMSWSVSASNSPASSQNGFSPPLQRPQQYRPSEQRSSCTPIASSSTATTSDSLSQGDFCPKSAASDSSCESDSDMDTDSEEATKKDPSNGVVSSNGDSSAKPETSSNNGVENKENNNDNAELLQEDEDDGEHSLCGGNPVAIERMMQFGQQLLKLASDSKTDQVSSKNKHLLKDAFSLLAYKDPWNCPVGYQLDSSQREPLCAALNSAILESQNLPKKPPLLTVIGQAQLCVKKMLSNKIGSAAFVSVSDYLS